MVTDEQQGAIRPHVDYEAVGEVSREIAESDEVNAEHPPEYVLDTLRDWMNFE